MIVMSISKTSLLLICQLEILMAGCAPIIILSEPTSTLPLFPEVQLVSTENLSILSHHLPFLQQGRLKQWNWRTGQIDTPRIMDLALSPEAHWVAYISEIPRTTQDSPDKVVSGPVFVTSVEVLRDQRAKSLWRSSSALGEDTCCFTGVM